MSVMKSVLGGLIGAAIASGIYYAIKTYFLGGQVDAMIWFPIVTGILTGGFANLFRGKSCGTGARLAAGALAGLIAALAMFSVDILPSLLAKNDYGPLSVGTIPVARNVKPDVSDSKSDTKTSGSKQTNADGSTAEQPAPADDPDPADKRGAKLDEKESTGDEKGGDSNPPDETAEVKPDQTESTPARTTDDAATDNSKQVIDSELNELFKNRGTGMEKSAVDHSAVNMARNSDLIRKKTHQSWLQFYLPYIFNGIGILLAYQLARGFGSAPKS